MAHRNFKLFGWVYVLTNTRLWFYHKVGITRVGVSERAKNIDESMRGEIRVIFSIPTLFPLHIEKCVHDLYDFFGLRRVQRKSASGHTEWFLGHVLISFALIWIFNIISTCLFLVPFIIIYFLTIKNIK